MRVVNCEKLTNNNANRKKSCCHFVAAPANRSPSTSVDRDISGM